jgi:hypothetical protein
MARSRSRRPALALALLALLGAPAAAGDLFVPGDYATIQAAIEASVAEDVIHVAAGMWPGALQLPPYTINILGAGADLTRVDGLGAAATVTTGALGLGKLSDLAITGGVLGADATSGTLNLTRCMLRENSSHGAQGNIIAADCSFLDNGGNGLSPFISAAGCTFAGNAAWGAEDLSGVFGPPVSGCRFLGNGLGGLRIAVASPSEFFPPSWQISYCIFDGDKLQGSATLPGGAFVKGTVSKCSFRGGGIKLMQGALELNHVIVRADPALQDFSATGDVFGSYSNIQGGLSGFTNIDADPLWVEPDNGDFGLQPGSPCINTGSVTLPLDPDGSTTDMGAVNYHPWTDLGGGVAGAAGPARLTGGGPLIASEALSLQLSNALPGAAAWLFVGLAELGVPFKGGTLWPSVDAVIGPLTVPAGGELALDGTWPAALPDGFSVWSQYIWPDVGAVQGWALSNGLRGVQP